MTTTTRWTALLMFALAGCLPTGGGGGGSNDDPMEMAPSTPESEQRALVSGRVTRGGEGDDDTPVAGARVQLVGTEFEATTGDDGRFEIDAPVGRQTILAEHADYWGGAIVIDIPAAGIELTDDLTVIPESLIAQVYGALGVEVDPTRGILFVDFDTDHDGGGETASIDAAHDGAFTFDDDAPVASDTVAADGDSFIAFTNVQVGSTVVDAFGAPGATACDIQPAHVERWPVFPRTLTQVVARCADRGGARRATRDPETR